MICEEKKMGILENDTPNFQVVTNIFFHKDIQ
jgi:hypothetical protein